MGIIFGALTAGVSAWITFSITSQIFVNAGSVGRPIGLALTVLAALTGFLAGSAAYGRARKSHRRLGIFTALAFAVACGLVGCAFMVTLTVAYVGSYSPPGTGGTQAILTILAYPILGALGFVVGGMLGWLFGLLAGTALRVIAPAVRKQVVS